jgi:hypothetical protein
MLAISISPDAKELPPMPPTDPVTIEAPRHPLPALTTYELRDRRRQLEQAIRGISADAPVQADLRRALDAVLAEQQDRARLAGA